MTKASKTAKVIHTHRAGADMWTARSTVPSQSGAKGPSISQAPTIAPGYIAPTSTCTALALTALALASLRISYQVPHYL